MVEQDIKQRAINAQVLLAQPFWQELCDFAGDLERESLRRLYDAQHADPLVVKSLHNQWITTTRVLEQLLRYPHAAVEAGADATQQPSDWRPESVAAQMEY